MRTTSRPRQTRSYAAHKALNEFYDEIVDLADSFAEAYIAGDWSTSDLDSRAA